MPEPRILLCGPAPSRTEPAKALAMLGATDLPKLTKCVLTDAKFDTQKAAKTFNIDADYSPVPPQLQTLGAWAGLPPTADQVADAIELYALRSIIERDGPFGYAILQRGPGDIAKQWPTLREKIADRPFLCFGKGNVLLNLGKPNAHFLDLMWDLYVSGAAYAIDPYSFEAALGVAAEAMQLDA